MGYIIYTDGSCVKDSFGGASAVITYNNNVIDVICMGSVKSTNNIMEGSGILIALDYIKNNDINEHVCIYSDSQYMINTINQWYANWRMKNGKLVKSDGKEAKNPLLIQNIMNHPKKSNCEFKWIRGHQQSDDIHVRNNNLADKYATLMSSEISK